MKLFRLLSVGVALLSALVGVAVARPAGADEKGAHYVCPPCGMECDHQRFDKPGACPVCGAQLVPESSVKAAPRKTVGILLFDGVEIIDFTGPYEVFGGADYDVVTVGETNAPVTTAMGMRVVPRYGFVDAPHADVVVVPGGSVKGASSNGAILRWVREANARAVHTLSVCNGAFILANAGLLDGLTATTTAHWIDALAAEFPKTKVVRDQRFVDNGKIVTAGGLSAGIDGALHVLAVMEGTGTAQSTALALEYDWRPSANYARAALADRMLPDVGLDDVGTWSIDRTEGTTDRWNIVAHGASALSASELEDRIAAKTTAQGWTRASAAAHGGTALWKLTDRAGRPWTLSLGVEHAEREASDGPDTKRYVIRCAIARSDAATPKE